MQYRPLGRTGVSVTSLSLGTMLFGGAVDEADAARQLEIALDAGVNGIDTANVYGRGTSEELLGRLLQKTGRRDQLVLASKFHCAMNDDDPNAAGSSRRHIIDQCEASLRRLGVDNLDVYYIHRPTTQVPIDETLRALDDLVRSGKIRYIGTSSFAAWQLLESLWAAKEHQLNRPVVEQTPYNLLDRRVERELLPMASSYGIGITVWSPLAGGLLTGKYQRGASPSGVRLTRGNDSDWDVKHFGDHVEPSRGRDRRHRSGQGVYARTAQPGLAPRATGRQQRRPRRPNRRPTRRTAGRHIHHTRRRRPHPDRLDHTTWPRSRPVLPRRRLRRLPSTPAPLVAATAPVRHQAKEHRTQKKPGHFRCPTPTPLQSRQWRISCWPTVRSSDVGNLLRLGGAEWMLQRKHEVATGPVRSVWLFTDYGVRGEAESKLQLVIGTIRTRTVRTNLPTSDPAGAGDRRQLQGGAHPLASPRR